MQNKRFIILISVVVIIIVGAFGALFYYSFQKSPVDDNLPAPIELTDFGTKTPSEGIPAPFEPVVDLFQDSEGGNFAPVDSNMTQVSNLPVAGAVVFETERMIEGLPALSFSFYQDLKLADKNPDVRLLQIFLNSVADKLDPSEPVIGPITKTGTGSVGKEGEYFGEATKKTLIKFQTKYGLTADGIFSGDTRTKANDLLVSAPQDLLAKLTGPQKNTESIAVIRYADELTGNIYESFLDKLNENKRLSSTQIFRIKEAFFGNNGSNVALRYLKDDEKNIETFLGIIPNGTDTELKGSFLPENVLSLNVSPDGKNIFYIFSSGNGVVGINSLADGSQKSQIFDSAFSEWLTEWPNSRVITLATKPSYTAQGYLYSFNPSNGALNKIMGGIAGLTAKMSPDGNLVLYTDSSLNLNLYNLENKTSSDLGIDTLPEKCVWSKNSIEIYCAVPHFISSGNYPDTWYQGEVTFNDSIFGINLSTGTSKLVADPSSVLNKDIDAVNLFLSPTEGHLFLTNKKDSILWSVNLSL